MNLKWEHKIYEKDFETHDIYLQVIEEKLEKLTEDYEELLSLKNQLEDGDYNSEKLQKALESIEDAVSDYKNAVSSIENLLGDLK